MRSHSPGRPWSVNRKIAAARWTFTADLTLTVGGCDGVPESTVQVAQTNHCVQGCAMHNCREREALDHLAVGRVAHVCPAVLANFRVCFNNGLTMFFFSERK